MAQRLDLNGIDLNLLPKFRALYRRRSVSEAARDLHVTQSALSNSLARMRTIFADELFVRTSLGMEPTPVARALVEPVERALARLESGLSRAGSFVAAESSRTFRIGMTQLAEAWLAPPIASLVQSAAPNVAVETVQCHDRACEDALRDGPIDLAIGDLPELGPGFRDEKLATHPFVCIVRKDHPIFASALTERAFRDCTFVEVVEHGAIYSNLSRAMMRMGRSDAMRFKTSNVLTLPYLIGSTDLVGIVPRWFAGQNAETFGLRLIEAPAGLPPDVMKLFWHTNNNDDAAHAWMRTLIVKAASLTRANAAGAEPIALLAEASVNEESLVGHDLVSRVSA